MEGSAGGERKTGALRYGWPPLVGGLAFVSGFAVFRLLGMGAFLNVHFFLEMGLVVSMFAAVLYCVRLSGKGRDLAPRWIFWLNLCYGGVLFGAPLIRGVMVMLSR